MIILGVLVILGAGGAAGLLFFLPGSAQDSSIMGKVRTLFGGDVKPAESSGPGHICKMEPFLVNLIDPGQLRYLKVTVHAESNREKESEEFEKRLPQLRDAVLTILSSKNYKEIITAEGKSALREEIKGKLNQLLSGVKVQNVYFTEFVVQ